MRTVTQIAEIHQEVTRTKHHNLSDRDRDFVASVHAQAQRPSFTGLTERQESWLNAIGRKLAPTWGKQAYQIVAERSRARLARYRSAYTVAIFGR